MFVNGIKAALDAGERVQISVMGIGGLPFDVKGVQGENIMVDMGGGATGYVHDSRIRKVEYLDR